MSEDKMREEHWRQWGIAGMPKDKIRLAEETWKTATEACAAIKDAEIAHWQQVVVEENRNSQKEIAARDLMIKELRDEIQNNTDFLCILEEELFDRAMFQIDNNERILMKSEHHNSRALEKMLLEAELKGLKFAYEATYPYSADSELLVNRIAELNKE